jgi:hypothetical protein
MISAMSLLAVLSLAAAAAASPDLAPHREGARVVLKHHCGACHDPARPTANARAMKIYDLAESDFAGHMTPGQLEELARRLEARRRMTPSELKASEPRGAPAPNAPTDQEILELKIYVTLELISRAH